MGVGAWSRRAVGTLELSDEEVLTMTRLGFAQSTSLFLVAAVLLGPATVASAQDPADAAAQRQYNTAVGLHNSGAYDLAGPEWKKYVESYPDHENVSKAWHYLGICQSKLNKLDEAIAAYQTVVTKYPDCELLEDTYLNLGLTQYNIGIGGKPALYGDAAKTAILLTHRNQAMLYQHYRGRATKSDAEAYFSIVPSVSKV